MSLVAVAVAVGIVLPLVLNRFMINVLTLSLVFALLAMSANLLGHAGLASLGQAGLMAAAAYGFGYVTVHAGGHPVGAAAAGVAAGAIAGLLFGVVTVRTQGVYFILATLALGMVVWGLSIRLTPITGGENGLRGLERPGFAESYRSLYYLCAATVVVGVAAARVISRSPYGLVLRGMRDQENRLRMLGCPIGRFKVLAFTLSGLFAGVAGVLYAYYNRFVNPSAASFNSSGKAVLMVLVGGIGTLAGPIIGAIVVTAIENVVSNHTARWQLVLGLLYIVTVLFARDGIAGRVAGLRRTAGRRIAARADQKRVSTPSRAARRRWRRPVTAEPPADSTT